MLQPLQVYLTIKELASYTVMTKTASTESIGKIFLWIYSLRPGVIHHFQNALQTDLMTTSGSGAFYAFAQDSGAWVLKKIDTEDEAFSLCTHESKYFWLEDFSLVISFNIIFRYGFAMWF